MDFYPVAIEKLIEEFAKLPSIGQKTAQRLTLHILNLPEEEVKEFATALVKARGTIKYCSVCGNFTDKDPCAICGNPNRDKNVICVVEQPQDVATIESSHEFSGLFHVLGGVIAPLEGVGPDQLNIQALLKRLSDGSVKEVIIATNPTVEGDTTALYLQRMIVAAAGIKVTRLASGLPVGGDLEYADKLTLARSFRGRTEV